MSGLIDEYRHIPVLLDECIELLCVREGDVFVDATLGGAGHSLHVAPLLGASGLLLGIDQDDMALSVARERLENLGCVDNLLGDALIGSQPSISHEESDMPVSNMPRYELLRGNFGCLDDLLLSACVPGIDAILFDIGVSSVQIDTPERGFSFKRNAPLDMRMSPNSQTLTAEHIVNTYSEAELTRIFREYGEEKWATRIAQFVCKWRESTPIETSAQLVDVIKAAIPASARRRGGHPAKRVFQALRIEVNGELDALSRALEAALRWLNPRGRLAVISYHSLEDRIVKETFASFANRCTCPPDMPVCACGREPVLRLITRKPILPSVEEIERNPRSRSAKLRVAQKI